MRIEEVEKEVAWKKEWNRVHLHKLEDTYYNRLMYKRFGVKALKTKDFVHTIRLEHMSEFLNENLANVRRLLDTDANNTHHEGAFETGDQEGALMSESESNRGN